MPFRMSRGAVANAPYEIKFRKITAGEVILVQVHRTQEVTHIAAHITGISPGFERLHTWDGERGVGGYAGAIRFAGEENKITEPRKYAVRRRRTAQYQNLSLFMACDQILVCL